MNQRNLLITGGNRGIGYAIVKKLAEAQSDTILLGCRNLKEGQALAKEIAPNVHAVKIELSHRETLNQNIQDILRNYKKIDVLINNAGILNEGKFDDISLEKFDESIRVNTVAPYELIKRFTPGMKENSYGRIVNISSGWGSFEEGLTGPFSYSFSKAALNALTASIAKDLPKNIKINSMCPGWVRTRMGGMMATRSPEQGAETAVWLANLPEEGASGGFYRDKKLIEW